MFLMPRMQYVGVLVNGACSEGGLGLVTSLAVGSEKRIGRVVRAMPPPLDFVRAHAFVSIPSPPLSCHVLLPTVLSPKFCRDPCRRCVKSDTNTDEEGMEGQRGVGQRRIVKECESSPPTNRELCANISV